MDTVTYPDKAVTDFVNQTVVPLRIPADSEPLATQFGIKWTPALIILDWEGKEHSRTVGYLTVEEFIPSVLLGISKMYYDFDKYPETLALLDRIITTFSATDSAPAAIFWKGVTGYKHTHDPKPLRQAWDQLSGAYPGNMWTKRAMPYRLIP